MANTNTSGTGKIWGSRMGKIEVYSPKIPQFRGRGQVYIPSIAQGYFGDGDNLKFGDLVRENPRNSSIYEGGTRVQFSGILSTLVHRYRLQNLPNMKLFWPGTEVHSSKICERQHQIGPGTEVQRYTA